MRVSLLPDRAAPLVAYERGGDRGLVAGGVRLVLASGGGTVSSELFAAPIVDGGATRAGWVFRTEDGALSVADDFTGTTHRLGRADGASVWGLQFTQRFGVLLADGTVSVTDGTSAPAPLALGGLPNGPLRAIAFWDATHAAAIAHTGALFVSNDGGTHFRALALPARYGTATELVARVAGGLYVHGTRGVAVLDANGRIAPRPDAQEAAVSGMAHLDLSSADDFLTVLIHRFPGLLLDPSSDVLPDGTVRAIALDSVYTCDPRTGEVRGRVPMTLPTGCIPHLWGPAIAIDCNHVVTRSPDLDTQAPVTAAGSWDVYSDDGLHAARQGPCDPSAAPGGAICALRDGDASTREIRVPALHRALGPMHGNRLLAWESRADGTDALHWIDTDDGSDTAVRLDATPAGVALRWVDAQWSPEGAVVVLLAASSPTSSAYAVAVGDPSQPLAYRELPAGATSAGFADGRHGVAAGPDLAHLWRTDDGGRSFAPVEVPVQGDAASLRFEPADAHVTGAQPLVLCLRSACRIGTRVYVSGWGPLGSSDSLLVAPATH